MENRLTACARTLLTSRESDVLSSLLTGDNTKETAKKMGISPKTVETYRARIRAKFRARNTVELIVIAMENGLKDRVA